VVLITDWDALPPLELQDHVCIIGNNFLIHTYYLPVIIHGHATREECAFMQTNIFEIDIA
ncbi:hypothetical protein ACJX0J_035118, partial [Zea mays]